MYAGRLADPFDSPKRGLSERAPEGGTPVAELAERIKALRASVTVKAAPERVTRKAARAERPVTARIRERRGEMDKPVEAEAVVEPAVELKTAALPAQVIPMPEPVKPDYRQAVVKRRQGDGRQLSLF